MNESALHYLADTIDSSVEINDFTVKSIFEESLLSITSVGSESIGDMVVDLIRQLIRLITSIIYILGRAIKKLFNFIVFKLNDISSNIRTLKSRMKDPNYTSTVFNNIKVSQCVEYKVFVDNLYKINDSIRSFKSFTDMVILYERISKLADLEADDTGIYLPPIKYIFTEKNYNTIKNNLELIGIKVDPISSEISNNEVVYTSCNITYNSKLLNSVSEKVFIKDLGYTPENIVNAYENSFSQFYTLNKDAISYVNTLEKMKDLLVKLQAKAPYISKENISDPNHKVNRVRLLIANIGVSINLFSKVSVASAEYISWFSQLVNIAAISK